MASILGPGCLEFSLSVPSGSHSELFMSLRSHSCLGVFSLIFQHVGLSSSIFLRSLACVDLLTFSLGSCQTGLALSLLQNAHIELPSLSQSFAQPDSASFIVDMIVVESMLPVRSLGCVDFVISVWNFGSMASSMPLRQHTRIGLVVSVPGKAIAASSLPLLDFFHLGFFLLLHSSS